MTQQKRQQQISDIFLSPMAYPYCTSILFSAVVLLSVSILYIRVLELFDEGWYIYLEQTLLNKACVQGKQNKIKNSLMGKALIYYYNVIYDQLGTSCKISKRVYVNIRCVICKSLHSDKLH